MASAVPAVSVLNCSVIHESMMQSPREPDCRNDHRASRLSRDIVSDLLEVETVHVVVQTHKIALYLECENQFQITYQ